MIWAREQRLKEMKMWSIIRELVIYLIFLSLLYFVTYSNMNHQSFDQVKHFREFFLNSREIDRDFSKVRRRVNRNEMLICVLKLDIDEE